MSSWCSTNIIARRAIALALTVVLSLWAGTISAEPETRALSPKEQALIAETIPQAADFLWYPYRARQQSSAFYCAMAALRPASGGMSVFVPFYAVVEPNRGPLTSARLVALGGPEPLAPLNLLIGEMCDRAGYLF
jgi:hypothetical protein